jgi:hypothetical protein
MEGFVASQDDGFLALLWQKFTWVFDEAASAVRAMVGR